MSTHLWNLTRSIATGLLMAILLLIPFAGPFTVGLLLFPLEMTGLLHDAEVGFAWITFKSSKSFFEVPVEFRLPAGRSYAAMES